jgi:fibronectin-binding autotransporter adhesin
VRSCSCKEIARKTGRIEKRSPKRKHGLDFIKTRVIYRTMFFLRRFMASLTALVILTAGAFGNVSQSGNYTVLLSANGAAHGYEAGYGTISVDAVGVARTVLTLSDGKTLMQAAPLTDGTLPVLIRSGRNKLSGAITFNSDAASDCSGTLTLNNAVGAVLRSFTLIGSRFETRAPVLTVPGTSTNFNFSLSLPGSSQTVSVAGSLGTDNSFALPLLAASRVTLQADETTGRISGKTISPHGASRSFGGVVFQKQNFAAGLITQLGEIFTITPAQSNNGSAGNSSSSGVVKTSGGTLILTAGNPYGNGTTINLNGGLLTSGSNVGVTTFPNPSGSEILRVSGGNSYAGGATISLGGFNAGSGTVGAVTSGSSIVLSGSNLYTGGTVLNSGTLNINLITNSALASQKFTIAPGVTLNVQTVSAGNPVTITIINTGTSPVTVNPLQSLVNTALASNQTTVELGANSASPSP